MAYEYQIYPANDDMEAVTQDKPATLEQLQGWVGGYIEIAPMKVSKDAFGHRRCAIVNEEGLLKHLPVNEHYPRFVGTVVIGYLD